MWGHKKNQWPFQSASEDNEAIQQVATGGYVNCGISFL